uniref:TPR_REGION domain-containing protein n=1 Tax=Mesocestoides corti TaxID=53468 RepID=A0A5K3ESI6_MESCO
MSLAVTELTESELLELRKSDAWLPSEATRRCLVEGIPGPETLPCLQASDVAMGAALGPNNAQDPIRSLLARCYNSESKADNQRLVITADMVSQDLDGLMQLLKEHWYHAALVLTHRLLTSYGHGFDKVGQTSARLTPLTAQLWLLRLSLLKRTQQYALMNQELEAFGTLDYPDVYYEHAPHLYPGRKGSMVPFALRLLYAEAPRFIERQSEALDRLYFLAAVVARLISNLENGYTEDGSVVCPNENYQKTSLVLWRHRECRIYSCCLSIYLVANDYPSAIETVYRMISRLEPFGEHHFLYGVLGRIYLKFGDLESAERMFEKALEGSPADAPSTRSQRSMYSAMLLIADGRFNEAKRLFREVFDSDPSNVAAANNLAVCSLYLGQLEEGISLLELLTTPKPPVLGSPQPTPPLLPLHDSIVSNLAVLYEVESDRAASRKLHLLERLASVPGERLHARAFKLPLT